MFEGFDYWVSGLKAYLLVFIYTLLWSLLLIVPGIIASFSYSQTFFIMAEDPNIDVFDAIDKSKAMMKGNKWKLFCLELRFLGWFLLAILTLGIGFFWLVPYAYTTSAKFYEDIKNTNNKEPEMPQVIEVPIPNSAETESKENI